MILAGIATGLDIEHLKYWDLRELFWDRQSFHADFTAKALYPRAVRVSLTDVIDLNITDEVLYSTAREKHEFQKGHKPFESGNFAYNVKDGQLLARVPAWQAERYDKVGGLMHYAFLGLNDCIEAISHQKPQFLFVELSERQLEPKPSASPSSA